MDVGVGKPVDGDVLLQLTGPIVNEWLLVSVV